MAIETYLTLKQVAELLQVSERTLWELARDGKIPSFQVGKQYRFRSATLDDWAKHASAREGKSK